LHIIFCLTKDEIANADIAFLNMKVTEEISGDISIVKYTDIIYGEGRVLHLVNTLIAYNQENRS